MKSRRKLLFVAVLALGAVTIRITGCSGIATVTHAGKPSGTLTLPLDGIYVATLHAPYIGPLQMRIAAKPAEPGFIASTRPDVAWDMIGGLLGFVGQFVAPFVFPDGVILTWESHIPSATEPAEGWMQLGGLKSAGVKTIMTGPNDPIRLLTSDGRELGTLTLESAASANSTTSLDPEHHAHTIASATPLADYPALATAAATAIKSHLYDPDLAESSQVRSYISQLNDNAKVARDDLEFIFGMAAAGRNHLNVSLPLIIKSPTSESDTLLHDIRTTPDSERSTLRVSFDDATRVATLKAEAFLDAEDVDRAFQRLLSHTPAPKALVLDLWTCPGVSLSSFRALCWLTGTPIDAGVLIAPSQRAEAIAGKLDAIEPITISSASSIADLQSALDTGQSRRLTIQPESGAFTGPIAVVCSRKTTTTAEPIVALLKKANRACIFGNTTAGRPLVSRPTSIGHGWEMWIPIAEWRASDAKPGSTVLGKGIRPDANFDKSRARTAAAEWCADQVSTSPPATTPPASAAATTNTTASPSAATPAVRP